MRVHLVNPSHVSFGVGVITPRWLFVIAAATPREFGDPLITDETLEALDLGTVHKGDVVGIGIHTGNALRGYEIGRAAREAGAFVVFGGIHATLYPEEAHELGGAHAIVKGDGDGIWGAVIADCVNGMPQPVYDGGRIEAGEFKPARWDLLPEGRYMWASVQTVRGCPKHCSFCSVWRTDGQRPRQRGSDAVVQEIVELRRKGFRFIALADDNFYPVTLTDLHQASRRADPTRLEQLKALRQERFELMDRLAKLPKDMVFFTQITMEASEDPEFLDAMRRAHIKGALVGIESVTADGLKDIYKGFNATGDELVARLRAFRRHGVHVLGSFIFGLPSDNADDVRRDRGARRAGGAHLRAVRDADAVPRHGGLRGMGEDDRPGQPHRRRAAQPALADSPGIAPEGLHPAPGDVGRRDPPAHPGGLGSLLQPAADLEAIGLRDLVARAPCVRADFEAVPADVRQYRHRHRQRPGQPIGALGAGDRKALPASVRGEAHATPGDSLTPDRRPALRAPQRARDEPQAAEQQPEHHDRVEQRGLAEVDVHVHEDARQDDRGADAGQQPAHDRPAVVEQERDPDQEREQRQAESAVLPEPPERRRDLDLIQRSGSRRPRP